MSGRIIPRRFFDATEEPDRFFLTIQGYESCRLLSLRKSLEPIKSLLYDIDSILEIVEQNCQKPANKLTPDESGSIYLYTMSWSPPHRSLSSLLNEHLRSKNRHGLTPWFPFLKLFFTALCKLPSIKGTVWRGARANLCDHYNVDHVWWANSSCFESLNILESYLGTSGVRTIFQVECFDGKSLQSHSAFKDENEILLMPGSFFQVLAKWQAGKDLFMIQLRQKSSSYQNIPVSLDLSLNSHEKSLFSNEKKIVSSGNTTFTKSSDQNKKWKQKGLTIIGDCGKGNRLDQVSRFEGISIDENKTILIADTENHRVLLWKFRSKSGQIIVDENPKRNVNERIKCPMNVIFYKDKKSFIISDRENRRVIRCYGRYKENQEVLFNDIDCWGLAMDTNGNIFVSDYEKNEIRKWKKGKINGILVAGGNGNGNKLNQFNGPTYIFIDSEDSIYVADNFNHRIMKWEKNARQGIVVAGGNDFVDQFHQIFIADWGNHRIMKWIEGDNKGSVVVGGNGNGKESNQLAYPTGLAFDQQGNLYVADSLNYRIQLYEMDLD
ncbi:unnamed protein product [Adineta ricciae]|uniref:NAD(+)--protein-arginine ADP-ribosyltransferase n=2 Tax=Adineta ricciae TaxID=249248 RepID=A0A815GML2_ADIRI|nr:unnamed protein product [Adineta ricciae]